MTNYTILERRLMDGSWEASTSPEYTLDKSSRTAASSSETIAMRHNDKSFGEATPLMNHQSYDTFSSEPTFVVVKAESVQPQTVSISSSKRPSSIQRLCCFCCRMDTSSTERNRERKKKDLGIDWGGWTTVVVISIVVSIVAAIHGNRMSDDYTNPSWHFDYNVYNCRTQSARLTSRVALIAQVASSRPLESFSMISSRPNRAYAKAWGQDYVRYNAGRSHVYQRSCFDKVHVLNEILSQQLDEDDEGYRWSRRPFQGKYDTIVILPPDAIIIELDTDIIESMLPTDKLVAIGGWDENRMIDSHSGIVVFNLNHKYSSEVAKTWRDFILPLDETCGANNDLEILLSAIYAVVGMDESIDEMIAPLKETRRGFTGGHLVKSLVPSVPGYRDKHLERTLVDSKADLQQTVASVCYRFYPKCEVVL